MTYVRCVYNRKTLYFPEEPRGPADTILGLELGRLYKVVPSHPNDDPRSLRIVDGTGEDYPYPASYFEPFALPQDELATAVATVHLPPALKQILYAEALAHNTSVSALLRTWIDERLDLPVAA